MKKILLSAILVFATVALFAQWNTNVNDIYNTNTGNVGVGTTTPAQKFTVHNPSAFAIMQVERPMASGTGNCAAVYAKNASNGDIYFFGLKRIASGGSEAVQSAYDAASNTWRAFSVLNGTTGKFEIRAGVVDVEYKNSGNIFFNNTGSGVGIGVTSLGAGVKLQVAGKVKVQEVEVALTPWPDFVFNNDYKLRPLAEVEAFIMEHKHLPDVPSQAEVENNGLNLGEMNAVLMQKVEELTLYIISLQKQIDELKAEK